MDRPNSLRFLTLHPPYCPKGRAGGSDPQILPAGAVQHSARAGAVTGRDPAQDGASDLSGGKSWGHPPRFLP